jgi:hypothetical protein
MQASTPVLPSQSKVFQRSLTLYTLEPVIGGIWPIPEMLAKHLYYYPDAKHLASFKWT